MWGARGRRTFKSKDYLDFQNEIRDELMGTEWIFEKNQVSVIIHAGFSNRGADLDNCVKPVLDTYQSIFEDFNDNRVYGITLCKDIVPKGEEYLHITLIESETNEN